MKEAIFAIVDVIIILSVCVFASGLSTLLVRNADEHALLTPRLTVDRSVMICGDKEVEDKQNELKVKYVSSSHAMCALGEVFDAQRAVCDIEYFASDSFNPGLVIKSFQSDSNLMMHACGERLRAVAASGSAPRYTLIRSDAELGNSVDETMLNRLSVSQLRTNMLQKVVHVCMQEQSQGFHPKQILEARDNMRLPVVNSENNALRAMASLSMRGCPSVAHVGVGVRGDGFVAVLQHRPLPDVTTVSQVYKMLNFAFDEKAYLYALSILQHDDTESETKTEVKTEVESGDKVIREYVSLHTNFDEQVNRINVAEGASSMLHRYTRHSKMEDFQVLVDALSTVCVYSVAAGGYAHSWDVGLVQSLRSRDAVGGMHRASRKALDIQARFDPPTNEEFVYATTPNVFSIIDESRHDCAHTTRHFFADAYEAYTFQTLVSPSLHDRIDALFAKLQTEMQYVLQYPIIKSLFKGYIHPVQEMVSKSSLHMVGDTSDKFPSFKIQQRLQNTISLMLDQAFQATVDRMRHVYNSRDPCSMAPLFDGATTNAYFLYPFGCIVIGTGILVRPFADESYSDTALLMGIGFVMAHELGHALLAGTVDDSIRKALFHSYPASTYEEGIADLLGALTVLRIHKDQEDMCVRLQQIWCVYTEEQELNPEPSHPYPHRRWQDLCDILRRLKTVSRG
jgi:hypothetical protein